MLCSEAEEGQVPLSLELLYHSAQTRSPSDALMVAVHLLMLETGFVSEVCVCVEGYTAGPPRHPANCVCVCAYRAPS